MTDLVRPEGRSNLDDQLSLFVLANALLRRRRMVVSLVIFGVSAGVGYGLLSTRLYSSSATFIPEDTGEQAQASTLALAASQFGITLPSNQGAWGPPVYVEILQSRELLSQVAQDTIAVSEESGRREALMDLLRVSAPTSQRRVDKAVRLLASIARVSELKQLGAVRVTVRTQWPSVSFALAQRLLSSVGTFVQKVRKSQATAERVFVEGQADDAQQTLRDAEDRLQSFLQRNRSVDGSPELSFERDRLQRAVDLRQQMYTTLLESEEQARIREVRDTPVITVLEAPRLPVVGDRRRSILKGVIGGCVFGFLALFVAFIEEAVASARRKNSAEAKEFFRLAYEAIPRLLRGQRG